METMDSKNTRSDEDQKFWEFQAKKHEGRTLDSRWGIGEAAYCAKYRAWYGETTILFRPKEQAGSDRGYDYCPESQWWGDWIKNVELLAICLADGTFHLTDLKLKAVCKALADHGFPVDAPIVDGYISRMAAEHPGILALSHFSIALRIVETMHPSKWVEKMKGADCGDTEIAHSDADDILCDLLSLLGYNEVVEEYNKIGKWYA